MVIALKQPLKAETLSSGLLLSPKQAQCLAQAVGPQGFRGTPKESFDKELEGTTE